MTRASGTDKVSLTASNWAGVILTITSGLAGQWVLINSRVTTLEANVNYQQKQIDEVKKQLVDVRQEILSELRGLRQEIKPK